MSGNSKLHYVDYKKEKRSFRPSNNEIMICYKQSTDADVFFNSFGTPNHPPNIAATIERIPEGDTNDEEYSYAYASVSKPMSIGDFLALIKPNVNVARYMPAMIEERITRYFLPNSFVLRIGKTNTALIQDAEDKGFVLGYKIIRKYQYNSNQIGGPGGEEDDVSLVHEPNIINNNYGYYVVRLPDSPQGETTEQTLIRILRENNPDNPDAPPKPDAVDYSEVDEVLRRAHQSYTPVDPQFPIQWGMTGGNGTYTSSAWSDSNNRGHQNVIISVLDTGLRTTHDDFKYRSGWTPATLVINPWNVLTGTTDVSHTAGQTNAYHGSWVAGVSSARVDNADSGVAGVAWRSRITPVKISESDTVVVSNAEAGINYIIGKSNEYPSRRYIILIAWTIPSTASFQTTVASAINENILVVAASGDFNQDLNSNPRYPAMYTNVVRVGAHASDGAKVGVSNYGAGVLMGPGGGIITTDGGGNAATITKTGTSYAAAFVAGEAAIVWGRDRNQNGSFTRTNLQVKTILEDSSNLGADVPSYPNEGKIRTDFAANF